MKRIIPSVIACASICLCLYASYAPKDETKYRKEESMYSRAWINQSAEDVKKNIQEKETKKETEKTKEKEESEAPASEAAAPDTPASETAASETPASEAEASETPVSETAVSETPVSETPISGAEAKETQRETEPRGNTETETEIKKAAEKADGAAEPKAYPKETSERPQDGKEKETEKGEKEGEDGAQAGVKPQPESSAPQKETRAQTEKTETTQTEEAAQAQKETEPPAQRQTETQPQASPETQAQTESAPAPETERTETVKRYGRENDIKNVQRMLSLRGYDVSYTGKMNRGTREAIKGYRKERGMPDGDYIDDELLEAFGIRNANTIKEIQAKLSDIGYSVGTPDGLIGRKTQDAIERYKADKGLGKGSEINDDVLKALGLMKETAKTEEKKGEETKETGERVLTPNFKKDITDIPADEQERFIELDEWLNNNLNTDKLKSGNKTDEELDYPYIIKQVLDACYDIVKDDNPDNRAEVSKKFKTLISYDNDKFNVAKFSDGEITKLYSVAYSAVG